MVRLSGTSHGVLVVDKPGGMTSHDVVAQARKLYGTRAVGHAGTLDPMATGVLLLLFGEATKLSSILTSERKRYLTTVSFGRGTNSHDADGAIVAEATLEPGLLEGPALAAALAAELARTAQLPPAVSALKVGGERAHALVRAGTTPALSERPVLVHSLALVARSAATLTLELDVSRGYYVRSLARDLGAALGVPAHLSALRRLASGAFDLAEASAWPAAAAPALLGVAEAAARAAPAAVLTTEGERRARLGQVLLAEHFEGANAPSSLAAWLSVGRELIALGEPAEGGTFRVLRGFQPQLTRSSAMAKPL